MDSGPISIGEVKSLLKAQKRASFRMVVIQPSMSARLLHTLLIDVPPTGSEAPYNTSFSYNYGDVLALAGDVSGEEAGQWLREEGKVIAVKDPLDVTRTYEIGSLRLSATEEASGGATRTHYPSRAQQAFPLMRWPHTQYSLSIQGSQRATEFHRRLLIADGCPFFPRLEDLVGELIYGVVRTSPSVPQFAHEALTVRIAEAGGWIDQIDVSPASLGVAVKGDDLEGAHLQVSGGPTFHHEVEIPSISSAGDDEARHVNVPLLADPLPELWVVLSRGHSWLDYRVFPTQWSPFRADGSGIAIAPPDPVEQVKEYIGQGEGQRIEFKHQPPQEPIQKERFLKTVAAFANGEGGVILVGVEDNSGDIVGIQEANMAKRSIFALRDTLTDMVRRTVTPEPLIEMQHCQIEGKWVLMLFVAKGTVRPYGINPDKPIYYIRRGATSFPARPEEIRALIRSS